MNYLDSYAQHILTIDDFCANHAFVRMRTQALYACLPGTSKLIGIALTLPFQATASLFVSPSIKLFRLLFSSHKNLSEALEKLDNETTAPLNVQNLMHNVSLIARLAAGILSNLTLGIFYWNPALNLQIQGQLGLVPKAHLKSVPQTALANREIQTKFQAEENARASRLLELESDQRKISEEQQKKELAEVRNEQIRKAEDSYKKNLRDTNYYCNLKLKIKEIHLCLVNFSLLSYTKKFVNLGQIDPTETLCKTLKEVESSLQIDPKKNTLDLIQKGLGNLELVQTELEKIADASKNLTEPKKLLTEAIGSFKGIIQASEPRKN